MLLVVCAVPDEAAAVLEGVRLPRERFAIGPYDGVAAGPVTTVVGGIGPAAAAAATATALALGPYDAVVSAGIAGGFGDARLVVASQIVPADVGVVDAGRWRPFAAPVDVTSSPLAAALGAAYGPVLTVSEITATDARRDALLARWPGALAEAMEGYGIACAAAAFGVACHEVRAVSNRVGDRDRPSWDVPAALAALTACVPPMIDVLEPA